MLHFRGVLVAKIILLVTIFTIDGLSQNADSVAGFDSIFYSFKKSATAEFDRFQNQNDSIFLEFLHQNWIEYQLLQDTVKEMVKPKVQPRIDQNLLDEKTPPDTLKGTQDKQIHVLYQDTVAEKNLLNINAARSFFEFYGEINDLPVTAENQEITVIDNKTIITFYKSYLSDTTLRNISDRLKIIAHDIKVNDFGFFILTLKASRVVFREINKSLLFTWINLIRNGLDVRIGYAQNKVYLLLACDYPVRNAGYVFISGVKYNLYRFPGQEPPSGLSTYPYSWPGISTPIKMAIRKFPEFRTKRIIKVYSWGNNTISINLNKFLIDYLNEFSVTSLKFYFNTPVSGAALAGMDNTLIPLLKGKSEIQRVNLLLSFIQGSFPYKDDLDQFGHEKYMFCDEALYYPFTDCEDRAILLAQLIKRYTGLEVIGLEYPNHVSVGVKFTIPIKGDPIQYKNSKYFICDPTYMGAQAGMEMKEMKGVKPEVILIDN